VKLVAASAATALVLVACKGEKATPAPFFGAGKPGLATDGSDPVDTPPVDGAPEVPQPPPADGGSEEDPPLLKGVYDLTVSSSTVGDVCEGEVSLAVGASFTFDVEHADMDCLFGIVSIDLKDMLFGQSGGEDGATLMQDEGDPGLKIENHVLRLKTLDGLATYTPERPVLLVPLPLEDFLAVASGGKPSTPLDQALQRLAGLSITERLRLDDEDEDGPYTDEGEVALVVEGTGETITTPAGTFTKTVRWSLTTTGFAQTDMKSQFMFPYAEFTYSLDALAIPTVSIEGSLGDYIETSGDILTSAASVLAGDVSVNLVLRSQ